VGIIVALVAVACGGFVGNESPAEDAGVPSERGATDAGVVVLPLIDASTDTSAVDAATPLPWEVPSDPGCPPGASAGGKGPPMARFVQGGYDFCIDRTEVTVRQFAEFRAGLSADALVVPSTYPGCTNIKATAVNLSDLELPAATNYCSAAAFCAAAGKRLCGKAGLSGAATVQDQPTDTNEIVLACQGPTGSKPPDAGACAVAIDGGALRRVNPACKSSKLAVWDLLGNAHETTWFDATQGSLYVAGSVTSARDVNCRETSGAGAPRGGSVGGQVYADLGFRCCAAPRQ